MSDDLPDGWCWTTLGDITSASGTTDPTREPERVFTYVDISSVDREMKVVSAPKSILGRDAPSRARKSIRTGDVIVSMTRPNLNAVAQIGHDLDGEVCSTGFSVLRPSASIDPEFLYALVRTSHFVDYLSSKMKGASYPAVTDRIVREFRVLLPPLGEQRRIVARLDSQLAAADRARNAAEAQLDTLNAMPAALLRDVFGDYRAE